MQPDDLDFDLSVLDGGKPQADTAPTRPEAPEEAEPVGLEPVEPDKPSWGFAPVATAEPAPTVGTDKPASAPAVDPVEDQLNRRVRDLLGEARAAVDQGDREEALSILSRVAILDEDNEEATELEKSLRYMSRTVRRSHSRTMAPEFRSSSTMWSSSVVRPSLSTATKRLPPGFSITS